jgi:hypothetical protein
VVVRAVAVEVSHHIWVAQELLAKEMLVVIALITTPQVPQQVVVEVVQALLVVMGLAVLVVLVGQVQHRQLLVHL